MTPRCRKISNAAPLAFLSVFFLSSACATDVADPKTTRALELQGSIGKVLAVQMHLEIRDIVRDHDLVVGEQYTGFYFYERHRQHIALRGYFNAKGPGGAADEPQVVIAEYFNGKKTGQFVGTLDDRSFKGQWEATDSERSLPFSLRITSKKGPKS